MRLNPLRRRLVLVTLLVLLVHAMLLGGMPSVLRIGPEDARTAGPLRFATRTLPPEPPAPPAPPAITAPPRVPARSRPRPPPPAPATAATPSTDTPSSAATDTASVQASSAVATDATATVAAGPAPGGSAAGTAANSAAASAPAAPPPPAPAPAQEAAAATPHPQPPEPVRMVFDGRGEERGFIKYAASAELLWLPQGETYTARLEISSWGIRLFSWTSRGVLGPQGLMPTRFGDRRRGAELATHFQRDKGIISFSANNPDVPLQPGAQDKLSFLLQLSALVAGEPERFGSGSSVAFQAADAHNAQTWTFHVGALAPLELPGGTLQTLKLSKEPTLEFDQRIEVWLAPGAHYLPVRLRITEANGSFADLLWRGNEKPD